jgi:hypothetical protein
MDRQATRNIPPTPVPQPMDTRADRHTLPIPVPLTKGPWLAILETGLRVRLEPDNRLRIVAPSGLADLFALRLQPNPRRTTVGFARTSADLRRRWPELLIDYEPEPEP